MCPIQATSMRRSGNCCRWVDMNSARVTEKGKFRVKIAVTAATTGLTLEIDFGVLHVFTLHLWTVGRSMNIFICSLANVIGKIKQPLWPYLHVFRNAWQAVLCRFPSRCFAVPRKVLFDFRRWNEPIWQAMSIQVTNLSSGEVLTYSLPLLVGEVTPPLTQGHIKVTCFTEKRIRLWPICNGQFKILVPLKVCWKHLSCFILQQLIWTQRLIADACVSARVSSDWALCSTVLSFFQKGENKIELHFFDETVDFVLFYRVPLIRKFVRPIYIKPHDDDGLFQVRACVIPV